MKPPAFTGAPDVKPGIYGGQTANRLLPAVLQSGPYAGFWLGGFITKLRWTFADLQQTATHSPDWNKHNNNKHQLI